MIQTALIPSERNAVLHRKLSGCRPGGGCCAACGGGHLGDDGASDDAPALVPVMYNPVTDIMGPVAPAETALPLFSSTGTDPDTIAAELQSVPAAPPSFASQLSNLATGPAAPILLMVGLGAALLMLATDATTTTGRKRR